MFTFPVSHWSSAAAVGDVYNLYHVYEEQASGVASAGNDATGAFNTMVLNTERFAGITGASLSANRVTLPAGDYEIYGYILKHIGSATTEVAFQSQIYDVTGAAVLLTGQSGRSAQANLHHSIVAGRITLAVQSDIEIRGRFSNSSGVTGTAASTGLVESYTDLAIWEIV